MPTPTFASGHDLVGRYRIGQLLGVGHVAEVYLADDLSLRRPVVIKVLLASLAGYEDVKDAERLCRDPALRAGGGGRANDNQAACTSEMARSRPRPSAPRRTSST